MRGEIGFLYSAVTNPATEESNAEHDPISPDDQADAP